LIFINKFIKYNGVNEPYYAIKYFGLYPYFNFLDFNFVIVKKKLFIYLNNY